MNNPGSANKILVPVVVILTAALAFQTGYSWKNKTATKSVATVQHTVPIPPNPSTLGGSNFPPAPPPPNSSPANSLPPMDKLADSFFNQDPLNSDWNPFEEMQQMQERMDRLFQNSIARGSRSPALGTLRNDLSIGPPMNLEETKAAYIVTMDIPGVDGSTIKVSCKDNLLSVDAEQKQNTEKKDQNGNIISQERVEGKISRQVTLPGPAKSDGMTTDYKDGVLTINIPRDTIST